MNIPDANDTANKQSDSGLDQSSASFEKTFESLQTLVSSKMVKLATAKNLMAAEAKLSLSAILLSLAISLMLFIIVAVIWILVNVGLGLMVYHVSLSSTVALVSLLVLNLGLGLWLFKQLKSLCKLVGFPATVCAIKNHGI